jgi:H+-transporting ATPase
MTINSADFRLPEATAIKLRPARILSGVPGRQILATLIAVYGLFMMPLRSGWPLFVLGVCAGVVLVSDRIKLLAYRIFDHTKTEVKPQISVAPQPQVKTETPREAKAEPKSDAKPDAMAHPASDASALAQSLPIAGDKP